MTSALSQSARVSLRQKTCLLVALAGLMLPCLSGCAAKRMKADFIGFEKAYAETSNREVLLNLARLQNRDPTYFFKLGQISSSYRMQATLAGAGNYVIQGTGAGGNATGGGTPALTFENDPSFTFIPVNDETNAQLLLKPVSAETFYILYQQGWRVDQLFRLMVDRIELTRSTPKGCSVETIRNLPPPVYFKKDGTADADYQRDAGTLSSYVTFLRVSAVVYALQKHGSLLLRGSSTFVPFDNDSITQNAPTVADIASASAKNASWEHLPNGWVLGQKVFSPLFYLNPLQTTSDKAGSPATPDLTAIRTEILRDNSLEELKQGPALDQVLAVLAAGFSIEGANSQNPTEGFCQSVHGTEISSHLVMRSLLGLMAAAAQEQSSFDALGRHNPIIPPSPFAPQSPTDARQLHFVDAVPTIERLPALRLKWEPEDRGAVPLVQVSYMGTEYFIADSRVPDAPENQYWNRDMFRLIGQLTAQVTVDISKFPLPDILQLRTQ
jgi:hypothetical protein